MAKGPIALAIMCAALAGCESCKDDRPAAPTDAAAEASPQRDGSFVNETAVPTATVMAVVNPYDAAPYAGATGSIEGTVTVTGDPAPSTGYDFSKCPSGEAITGKLFRVGPNDALADAIVAVQAFPDQFVPEKSEVKTVHVVGCSFDARTVTLTYGQRLDVKNDGDLLVFPGLKQAPSIARMAATPHGDPVRLYPPKPGIYELVELSGRTYMTAKVYVAPHPMHATTDDKGHYRIDGIPVGKRKVQAHHPEIGDGARGVVHEIEIVQGVVQKLDFVVKYTATPDAGASQTPVDAGTTPADAGRPAPRDAGRALLR